MDNYLIMGHILRCKLISKDQVHPELWVGANRKWRAVPRGRLTRVEHNKVSKALLYTLALLSRLRIRRPASYRIGADENQQTSTETTKRAQAQVGAGGNQV